jgi:mannose/fructose/N-acetylgalactosamine-specific phosphotransferase system component IIB
MSTVLRLAAPSGLSVDVLSIQDAVAALSGDVPDRATTMVLVRSPAAASELYAGGLRFGSLNVGGLSGGPGRTNVFRNIALSPEDSRALQYLSAEGVQVTLQTLPGERSRHFSDLAPRHS